MAPRSLQPRTPQPGKFRQLALPGIDFVPAKLRAHGLREAHTHPLVSRGRKPDGTMALFRVRAVEAWQRRHAYRHVELRTPTSWTVLVYDIDRYHAHESIVGLAYDGLIPWPNWEVERLASTHGQVVITLARPVLRGERARKNPQLVLARCSEYLAQTMGADRGYRGVVARNPVHRTRQCRTYWGRRRPYTLAELRAFIPTGWRMPPAEELITNIGRNNHLFKVGTRWRWREENGHLDVVDYLVAENDALLHPLGFVELKGIAKSIDRYWDQCGRVHTAEFRARQAWRAERRAEKARTRNAPRDSEIMLLASAGWSEREIANQMSDEHKPVPKSTVHDVLTRDGHMQLPLAMLDSVPPPPSRMRQLQRQDRMNRVWYLHRQGRSTRYIAAELNVPRRTVRRFILGVAEAH